MFLLDSQKDQLYDLIEESGLSPANFTLYVDYEDNPGIKCNNSNFYFNFHSFDEKTFALYSPAADRLSAEDQVLGWRGYKISFKSWLFYLKRELTTPKKWDRLKRELESMNLDFNVENEKFSYEEYQEIEIKMTLLKESIPKIPELQDNIEIINQKLDHLTEMVKDLGKFDWRSLFAGTMVNIVTQLGVTPANAETFWNIVKNIFNTYLLR